MPVLKQGKETSRSLAHFLEAAVRQERGDESFIPVAQLYEQFIASGMDYAGACSSGYSEGGINLTLTAGVDWGHLIAPLGPFTLESQASGSGQRARRLLLVIQRQSQAPDPSFWSAQPICVMSLSGVHWHFHARLNLTAELSLPAGVQKALKVAREIGPEEVALSLDASIGADASVAYEVSYLSCQELQPHWYPSGRDAALVAYFDEVVGERGKGELKKSAADLLKRLGLQPARSRGLFGTYMTDDLVALLEMVPATSPHTHAAAFYRTRLLALRHQEKKRIKAEALAWLEEQASMTLTDPHVAPRLRSGWGRVTTEGLILALETARDQGMQLPTRDNQDYLTLLRQLKEEPPSPPPGPLASLCFLRLWGQRGSGDVQAAATLNANVTVREKEQGATLTAGAEARGALKFTSYRYQNWAANQLGVAPLVMTQDTTLTYREARLKVSGEVRVGGKERLSRDGTLPYRMLTYRSAVAFWLASDRPGTVTALAGSGLCYGLSLQYSRLCRKLQTSQASELYIQVIAAQLRVPPETLLAFVNQAWFLDPQNPVILPNDTIILESAWALQPGTSLTVSQPSNESAPRVEDLLKRLTLSAPITAPVHPPFTLQAITGRYRLADMASGSKTLFKLGFPEVGLPFKLGIQLQRVTEAGASALIDIDTWWVDTARRSLAINDPAAAYEGAVPHVVLFHQ